jgi:hypothetical protein
VGSSVILPPPGQPKRGPDPTFKSAAIPNVVSFGFDHVSPPSPLYVQRDDVINLQMITSQAGEIVDFNIRFLLPYPPQPGQPDVHGAQPAEVTQVAGGYLVTYNFSILQSGALRTAQNQNVQMTEGYLLSVAATARTATFPGQTFARVTLNRFRTTGSPSTAALPLIQSYVTIGTVYGWPGGTLKLISEGPGWLHSIQVANPAAGADWTFTEPANSRVRLQSLRALLTTSATAANRNIQLQITDGVNTVWIASAPASVLASTTQQFTAVGTNSPTGVVTTIFAVVVPPALLLPGAWTIATVTANIQAGDQWSSIWLGVEEWLDGI